MCDSCCLKKECGFTGTLDVSRWEMYDTGISFNSQKTVLSFCGSENRTQTICISILESGKISFSYDIEDESSSLYYSVNGVRTKIYCEKDESVCVAQGDTFCFIRRLCREKKSCETRSCKKSCEKKCGCKKECSCARIGDICFKRCPTCPTGATGATGPSGPTGPTGPTGQT